MLMNKQEWLLIHDKRKISNFINNKSLYIGEKVTMTEHMIQTAMNAEKAKSSDSLVCACLLHDYGHFILENPDWEG